MKLPSQFGLRPSWVGMARCAVRALAVRKHFSGAIVHSTTHDHAVPPAGRGRGHRSAISLPFERAFTMVEIAICLAVIGFALVAIIGVLPIGMNVQKDNREETVINFDANYLMTAIRNGAQDTNTFGPQSLTNYIIGITTISTLYNSSGVSLGKTHTDTFSLTNYNLDGKNFPSPALTNNAIIISLLSKPKYTYLSAGNYYSNYVTADFRAITGSPLDQGSSQASKDFAFVYRVAVEIIPSAAYPYQYVDFNGNTENFSAPGQFPSPVGITISPNDRDWALAKNRQANLNEIRLRFRWPVLPGGKLGTGNQVYRTSASGVLTALNGPFNGPFNNQFRIQPQTYAAAQ